MTLSREFERTILANREAGNVVGSGYLESLYGMLKVFEANGDITEIPVQSPDASITGEVLKPDLELLGRILRSRRTDLKITVKGLAKGISVSPGYVGQIEHGIQYVGGPNGPVRKFEKRPSFETLENWGRASKLLPSDIISLQSLAGILPRSQDPHS